MIGGLMGKREIDEIEEFLVPGSGITRTLRVQWEGRCARVNIDLPGPSLLDEGPVDPNLLAAARMVRLVQNADADNVAWGGEKGATLHVWAIPSACGWRLEGADGHLMKEETGWEELVGLFDEPVPVEEDMYVLYP